MLSLPQGFVMLNTAGSTLSVLLSVKRDKLVQNLRNLKRVAVAFSGGIDSTVVAKAAFLALGDKAVAVTADSPSVARRELADSPRFPARTALFRPRNYVPNTGTRCYFCKSELYHPIETLLPGLSVSTVCSGANL